MKIILSISQAELLSSNIIDKIDYYIKCGVTGFRINLAKCTKNDNQNYIKVINNIVNICKLQDFNFIFDLPIPMKKTRILNLCIPHFEVNKNDIFIVKQFDGSPAKHTNEILVDEIHTNLSVGDIVYYGDGIGAFICTHFDKKSIELKAANNFHVFEGKSFSFDPIDNESPTLILNMCKELISILPNCIFALSFIETPDYIEKICHLIGCHKNNVLCKIETQKGIDNIDKLLNHSNGILLGRGDLYFYSNPNEFLNNCILTLKSTLEAQKDFYLCTDILISLINSTVANRADLVDISLFKGLGCKNFILPAGFSSSNNLKDAINLIKNINGGLIKNEQHEIKDMCN